MQKVRLEGRGSELLLLTGGAELFFLREKKMKMGSSKQVKN